MILDLWGISFHAVVVLGLGKDLLFKSVLGPCETDCYLDEKVNIRYRNSRCKRAVET